jgi:hypothetical protein
MSEYRIQGIKMNEHSIQYFWQSQERLVVLRLVHTTSEICLVHDITLFVAVHSYCQVTFQLLSLSVRMNGNK